MRRLLAVLSIVAMAACGGDSSTGATASVTGTFALSAVNGVGLPYVLQAANPKVELIGDTYTIASNGTFSQSTVLRVTNGTIVSTETIPDAGVYSQSGNAVTFTYNSDGTSAIGTLSGNTILMGQTGITATYTKQ